MSARAGDATFGHRLAAAMAEHGPVCFGIDPHPGLLESWGLTDDDDGLHTFVDIALAALPGTGAAIKPQSAFFERHGAKGLAVLERLLAEACAAGILTILDVKRGDIGSTMQAYAEAYLGDGPLAADAITVSPYLGFGALTPAIDLALANGRGVFVLCLTSNPEGAEVQLAESDGIEVAARIAQDVWEVNLLAEDLGSVGLVIGATLEYPVSDLGIDLAEVGGPILAPGFGAQGGDLARVFAGAPGVLASTSRAVLAAGPRAADLRAAAERARDAASAALE